jgi:hypothetical protein
MTLSRNKGLCSHVKLVSRSRKSGLVKRLLFIDLFVAVCLLARSLDPTFGEFAGGWNIQLFASMVRRRSKYQFGVLESPRWNDCQGSIKGFAILSFGLDFRLT